MWKIEALEDPLHIHTHTDATRVLRKNTIFHATTSIPSLLSNDERCLRALKEDEISAKVTLADFFARQIQQSLPAIRHDHQGEQWVLEMLDAHTASTSRIRRKKKNKINITPYILERTDVYCTEHELHVFLRVLVYSTNQAHDGASLVNDDFAQQMVKESLEHIVTTTIQGNNRVDLMNYVAVACLQQRLRLRLIDIKAVAFVANGSILPRKSGASHAPMASPPAIPFEAPPDSEMNQTLTLDMGALHPFLLAIPQHDEDDSSITGSTTITLHGLVVYRGISLIVGGGYHGKSTLLRCIAAGIYDKIPGDGREYSTTVDDAVNIRAEDGRYVNNCNISAFISNIPLPPGVSKALDTAHFSTDEASGSTSQAANVVEALEMGSKVFLVDEDVSAANFMSRDGRMRSLVADESITPLLYRVNGLFKTHGVSTIVVVGGVGDWLDVPNHVILMDKYVCKDATKKAASVSRQFSHGHVQYGGRGVVHRLDWDKSGTPTPRRPDDNFSNDFDSRSTALSIMDGGHGLSLHKLSHEENEDDEDDSYIDMSRIEQLLGKKPQLYGAGLCVIRLLEASRQHPDAGLLDLLNILDDEMDQNGFVSILEDPSNGVSLTGTLGWRLLVEAVGFAYRPRKFEVGQALLRLRGIVLEELPVVEDAAEVAARLEAERKKQELLEMWNQRRKK